jgi:hypothetical protein
MPSGADQRQIEQASQRERGKALERPAAELGECVVQPVTDSFLQRFFLLLLVQRHRESFSFLSGGGFPPRPC